MIAEKGERIEITIEQEALEKSIACLMSLKEFIEETGGDEELVECIQTAIETCQAFDCEHFGETFVEDET